MSAAVSHVKPRILVVEDEVDLSRSLSYSLEANGYTIAVADCGREALRLVGDFSPDLVLLDIMLPDLSGFEVCRQIRSRGGEQPAVVILTARTQETDRVAGFEVGADDYVVKPFSVRELMLRIEARLKARRNADSDSPTSAASTSSAIEADLRIIVGAVEIDRGGHRLLVSGQEIKMSPQEMRLLLYLANPPERMRTRRELLTEVWGYHPEVSSRTLDTHIKRIRDKLGTAGDVIQTVRGVGYRLGEARRRRSRAKAERHEGGDSPGVHK
jgi:two-component system phosphate regulon response regulator PhoB